MKRWCFQCEKQVDVRINDSLGSAICNGADGIGGCESPVIPTVDIHGIDRYVCLNARGNRPQHDVARPCDEIRAAMGHDFDYPLEEVGVWCPPCYHGQTDGRRIDYSQIDLRFLPVADDIILRSVRDAQDYVTGLSKEKRDARRLALRALAEKNLGQSPLEDLFFEHVLEPLNRRGWNWTRQQVLLDLYIVDFYDADRNIVIELDGIEHTLDPKLLWDQLRDEHLRTNRHRVLRFWNGRVRVVLDASDEEFEHECEVLADIVEGHLPDVAPAVPARIHGVEIDDEEEAEPEAGEMLHYVDGVEVDADGAEEEESRPFD